MIFNYVLSSNLTDQPIITKMKSLVLPQMRGDPEEYHIF